MWNAQPTLSLGDWASWAGALVAVVAAGAGFWQAHEARKARRTAQEQAGHAKDQAIAAREQVKLMEAERHERNAPLFTVDVTDSEEPTWTARFDLYMKTGPRLSAVTVWPEGQYICGTPFVSAYPADEDKDTFTEVGVGTTLTFYVRCIDGYQGTPGTLDVHAVEEGDEGRSWDSCLGFKIHPRPSKGTGHVW